MAKLPEYYAEEKAKKALERQEKLEAKRKAEADKKLAQTPTEEELKKQAEAQVEREQKFKEAQIAKKTKLEVLNPSKTVKKKEAQTLAIEGSVKYKQFTKEDKYGKTCVEKEKVKKDGTVVVQNKQNVLRLNDKQKNYYNEQNENVVKYFYREGTITRKIIIISLTCFYIKIFVPISICCTTPMLYCSHFIFIMHMIIKEEKQFLRTILT